MGLGRAPRRIGALLGFALTLLASGGRAQSTPPDSLPDPKLTPGDLLPVTVRDICVPGYSRKVRDVPIEVKRRVYELYGIRHHEPGEYEVDHLISLELGGSNSIRNLWPESYRTHPWNARVKDRLENRLHQLVCQGKLDLATAQREIATDWIAAYRKYLGRDRPTSAAGVGASNRSGAAPAPADSAGRVWVNTRSGVYFRPGARWYGKTRVGEYLSEAEAVKRGYRAAR